MNSKQIDAKFLNTDLANQADQLPDFDDIGLANRLRQSVNTIRAWRCRHPDRLPPGVLVGRVWLYDKKMVENWLADRRKSPSDVLKNDCTRQLNLDYKRRGKPTKEETNAAKNLGLTVPAWREQTFGAAKCDPSHYSQKMLALDGDTK